MDIDRELDTVPTIPHLAGYASSRREEPQVVRAHIHSGRGEILKIDEVRKGAIQSTIRITVDIEGYQEPARVVDTISRYFP
jgi:hypothetical protein